MDRIALIDGDFIMFYCGFGKKVLDENKSPIKKDNKFVYEDKTWDEVRDSVDSLLETILKRLKAKWYIGALTESKCFRYQIYPEYKANRKKLEKPKWFSEIKQYLKEKYLFMSIENLEADDIVNIYKNKLKDKYLCTIVSPDKDILSLEGTHFDPKNMKYVETDIDSAEEKFWKDMIIGQVGDNIKGIPGKGEKYVEKLFSTLNGEIYTYPNAIFNEYLEYFREHNGIKEFYKTYNCLKILDDYEGIIEPSLIKYSKIEEEDIYV